MDNFVLIPDYKEFYDKVHGHIFTSNLAKHFIDNKYFQKLRYQYQLSVSYLVFASTTHTRLEHSKGTYYLTGELLKSLIKNSLPENISDGLKNIPELATYFEKNGYVLDNYVCELVKIAALLHDIGHGPFSHVFDDYFIKKYYTVGIIPELKHEYRAFMLIDAIIKNNSFLSIYLPKEHIQFIKNIIQPPKNSQCFIYEIVANKKNSIDTDKLDYITRDCIISGMSYNIDCRRIINNVIVKNNTICYSEKVTNELEKLFETRYKLHKDVYHHKTVVSFQVLISEYMDHINDILNISASITDADKFCKITDHYILNFHNFADAYGLSSDKLDNITYFMDRIYNRNTFKHIITITSQAKLERDIVIEDATKHLPNGIINELNNNIVFISDKIGFISGKKTNPLDNVYIYNKNKDVTKLDKKKMSILINDNYQEYITNIYYRDRSNTVAISYLANICKKYN